MAFRDAAEAAREFAAGGHPTGPPADESGDLEALIIAAEKRLDDHFMAWAMEINRRLDALEAQQRKKK